MKLLAILAALAALAFVLGTSAAMADGCGSSNCANYDLLFLT